MTENEAINVLQLNKPFTASKEANNAIDIAIQALEKQSMVNEILHELSEYSAIGTIDEFKALKEKNEPKEPRFYAHNYYCSECGNLVGNNEFEWQRFLYCDNCGTKIDWQ